MDDLVERLRSNGYNALDNLQLHTEAASRIEALQAEVARLWLLAMQYRDDLKYPPAPDSKERRLAAITKELGDAT